MQEIHSPPAKRLRVGDRTLLACLRCKQKKLKCDGRSPKCQNCLKNVQECLIEDPATGLHRPRDHMQALESRVAYLEGLLQEVRPDLAADHMDHHRRPAFTVDGSEHRVSQNSRGDDARMNISQPPEGDIPFEAQPTVVRETHPVQASPARPAESDTVSSEVGLLCVNASGREPQYLGCSSALSFAHIATNAMGLQGDFAHQRSTWAYNAATVRHKDRTKLLELRHPAPAVAEALSQAFFDNIHPQYPFLHRPTFAKWERECQEANQKGTLQDVGHVPLFFVTMVYGIGSIALSHGLSGDAEDFYAMAMQHSPSVLNTDTLESVQALIACAVFSIRSPVGASLWMVSGMALRKSIGLGYHRSHHKLRRSSDVLPNEMAKRCFWVAYDIDRVTSFVLGRPPAISDQAIDVELPLDVNDEDLTGGQQPESVSSNPMSGPTTMTGAIHIIKLRRLWSKIHSLFYGEVAPGPQRCGIMDSTVQDLRQELEEWRQSVPPRIHHGNQKPLSVYTSNEWFILAYNHSILLLYRPFINDTAEQIMSTRSHPDLVEMAFDECYTNAQRMCMTYRSLYQQPSIQFTWGSLHILFLGGMTYLYCLWRSAKIRQTAKLREVMSTCMACSMVLVIVAERWGVATAYRDIFEKLSERTINMLELEGSRRTQIGYNNIGPPMTFQGPVDDTVPFDEWILDLDHAGMPPESDWLVQEMLDGVRGFGPHGTDDL